MLKPLMISSGALLMLATSAPAQDVRVGPDGFSIGRDHHRDWERRRWRHDDDTGTIVEHRYGRHCRNVTIRSENDDGDVVTKRIRKCD
jgi:hypothetical protein